MGDGEKKMRTKGECGVCENKRLGTETHTRVHRPVCSILQALAHGQILHLSTKRSRL